MKRIFILLFFISITFSSFAQEPNDILFANTWYLDHLEVDGEYIFRESNSEIGTCTIYFEWHNNQGTVSANACSYISANISNFDETSLSTILFEESQQTCTNPETLVFQQSYYEGVFKMSSPNHTFAYEIITGVPDPNIPELVITNEEGDKAFYYGETILGIETVAKPKLSVFPNPVKNHLNMTSGALLQSMIIYDIQGRQVYTSTFQETDARIDASSLKAGIYFLKAESETGQQLTAKFLKN